MVILAQILKKEVGEQSLLLILAFGILVFLYLIDSMEKILETMKNLAQIAQIEDTLLSPVVKTIAISVITKITGDICRSVGENGTASWVEIAGTLLALVVALPLIQGVMTMMVEML